MTTYSSSIGSLLDQINQNILRSLEGGLKVEGLDDLPTREERLARRLSLRRNLKPPVDLDKLASSLAIFSEEAFPVNIDGICLNLNDPSKRPEILINKNLRGRRRRFTLAHEIGHVIIPWHMGTIIDDIEVGSEDALDDYFQKESEANRFAAELLMPRQWCKSICDRSDHLRGSMHTILELADVSYQAAAVRTIEVGQPGYILSAERDGKIFWSKKTAGTRSRLPKIGTYAEDVVMPAYYDPEILCAGDTNYYWWKAKEKLPIPDVSGGEWRPILARMLSNVPAPDRHLTAQRINAVVGYAIGGPPPEKSREILFQRVIETLQNRQDRDANLQSAIEHPEVEAYVAARIEAFLRSK